jgi:hypothetical protein
MNKKQTFKRLHVIIFALCLGITWLIILAVIPIWRFYAFARSLRSENAEARAVVMQADPSLLLAGCRQLIAERDQFPDTMYSPAYAELCRRISNAPVEHLFVTNVPAAILALKPVLIEIDTNSVFVRIRSHSRDGLMYSEDSSLGYGNIHLTNGLWFFHDGEPDSQNTTNHIP